MNYNDTHFDLVITSNAPMYLSEVARVLKHEGLLLAVNSFAEDSFVTMEVHIAKYLNSSGITLLEIKSIENGVYILGQKIR